jgi:hypothetical protein
LAVAVAAKQRAPQAPAAAADQPSVGLGDEIRAIINELRVDTKGALQSALDLLWAVIARAKFARRARNQDSKRGSIGMGRGTQLKLHRSQL